MEPLEGSEWFQQGWTVTEQSAVCTAHRPTPWRPCVASSNPHHGPGCPHHPRTQRSQDPAWPQEAELHSELLSTLCPSSRVGEVRAALQMLPHPVSQGRMVTVCRWVKKAGHPAACRVGLLPAQHSGGNLRLSLPERPPPQTRLGLLRGLIYTVLFQLTTTS